MLVKPQLLDNFEAMRGKGIKVRGLALEAEEVHQIGAFYPALRDPHRLHLC